MSDKLISQRMTHEQEVGKEEVSLGHLLSEIDVRLLVPRSNDP